jgi:hypothetical protein
MSDVRPPKDDLVRSSAPFELRAEGDSPPTLFGHFTPFNTWTKIDSAWEGTFMERTVPGSFAKTIVDNRSTIKALFQHGQDPYLGDKPLGRITELREEDAGPYYEVELLDSPYIREEVVPGIRAGVYGSSYRFRVIREAMDDKPKRSDENPDGIPERTIKEVALYEFGPVTFPAYPTATAAVRSLTDELFLDRLRARGLLVSESIAPSDDAVQPDTSKERRVESVNPRFRSSEEFITWLRQPSPSLTRSVRSRS